MALTYTLVQPVRQWSKAVKIRFVQVTLDNSYPSGGYTLTAAGLNMPATFYVLPCAVNGGYVAAWDSTNEKLRIYKCTASAAAMTELGTTEANGLVVDLLVVGF